MTYVLLIYANRASDVELGPDDVETALVGHRALQAEAREQQQLKAVARLDSAGTARMVRRLGDGHLVTDGPFMETKEWLVGIYMIECADEDEAIRRARMLVPNDQHGIEVRPVAWGWTAAEAE